MCDILLKVKWNSLKNCVIFCWKLTENFKNYMKFFQKCVCNSLKNCLKFSWKYVEIFLIKTEWNFLKNWGKFSKQFSAVFLKTDRNTKFSLQLCEILLKSEWNSFKNCEIFYTVCSISSRKNSITWELQEAYKSSTKFLLVSSTQVQSFIEIGALLIIQQ